MANESVKEVPHPYHFVVFLAERSSTHHLRRFEVQKVTELVSAAERAQLLSEHLAAVQKAAQKIYQRYPEWAPNGLRPSSRPPQL